LSNSYQSALHIDIALTSAGVHNGTRIIVQTASDAGGDEFWTNYLDFVGPVGTANLEAVTNNPLAQGAKTITVASTTGYEAEGVLEIFLKDNTPANSELLMLTDFTSNTDLTVLDGTVREHANTSVLSNIAKSYEIFLPLGIILARVLYDNTYDDDGATVFTRARVVEVGAVA